MVCQGGITKYKALIAPCYTLTIQALRASHCISESSTLLKFANSLSATTLISLYTLPRDATYNVQNLEFIMREHRNWLNRLMLTSLIAYLEHEMIEVATALNR